ncbi:metallophosphoesterase [Methylobacterium soli]|uniref:Metallophosphoesterase n=1 Tax=Methylobacterium soli TaxID=553447 RepID=A0A6L3T5Z3_9HYPH|nr:metallophosphoesterase [Methylobacterium soli]KAB1080554.1 metallophosphoesterase [Methylobacterium soli]GJE45424.1 hypothetical protein AEGHOMDF_4619 [Methylobacterium soli]
MMDVFPSPADPGLQSDAPLPDRPAPLRPGFRARGTAAATEFAVAAPRRLLRLWVLSDLRVDREGPFALPDPLPDFDALLVAGGLADSLDEGLRWLASALEGRIAGRPVVMVAGSAEHRFAAPDPARLAQARDWAAARDIRLLADDTTRLDVPGGGAVHVVGCTLWTDWCLLGRFEAQLARVQARGGWSGRNGHPARPPGWLPHDALAAHARSRAYVEDVLAGVVQQELGLRPGTHALVSGVRPGDRAVVLTHHAPSRRSLPERWPGWFADAWLAASFASDLEGVMRSWGAPALWVHGAVPEAVDFRVARTRVVANPRGHGNGFDPRLVVEV